MRKILSWLHLSDLHFGHGDPAHRWDQTAVLHALYEDLKDVPAPDAIFVTGDVLFSGNSPKFTGTEYEDAKAWLLKVCASVKVAPSRLFLVPGNHDVDRGVDVDPNVARMISAYRGGEPIDTALATPIDREMLARRQAAYLRLARELNPACADLHWRHAFDLDGARIHIVGLNTALLSKDDSDHGRLQLGRAQTTALQQADDPSLAIALTHHPLRDGWLRDQNPSAEWVRKLAHVHLCGHVHSASSEDIRGGGGARSSLTVVAGAAHGDQKETVGHGYNYGAAYAVGNELLVRIWPRAWTRNMDFRVDPNGVPDGERMAEHWLGSGSWRLTGGKRKLRVTVTVDLEIDDTTLVENLPKAVGRELWKRTDSLRTTWSSSRMGNVILRESDRLSGYATQDGDVLSMESA